jgi:hypothetical protein
VSNDSESYRHWCEVRVVAAMATHDERRDFLTLVAKHRGQAAADRLRADALEVMGYPRPKEAA